MLRPSGLLFVCAAVCLAKDEISLKNATAIDDQNKKKNKGSDNPLKAEVRKYLRECGADVSDEDGSSESSLESNDQMDRSSDYKRRPTYPENYATWYEENQKKNKRKYRDVNLFERNRSKFDGYRDRNNNRRGNNNNQYYDDYEDDDSNDAGNCNSGSNNHRNQQHDNNRKGNRNRNKKGGNNTGNSNRNNPNSNQDRNRNRGNNRNTSNNRNENNRYDPYGNRYDGNEDFGLYGWGMNRGYNVYGGRIMVLPNKTQETVRSKRHNDDDFQCLSQCVFGYLGLLDDDRVPSETEVTKFIQNNIQNSSKRMQAIRDARRCFATLATSDIEDGCKFSKSIGNCLKLEIPDNS